MTKSKKSSLVVKPGKPNPVKMQQYFSFLVLSVTKYSMFYTYQKKFFKEALAYRGAEDKR